MCSVGNTWCGPGGMGLEISSGVDERRQSGERRERQRGGVGKGNGSWNLNCEYCYLFS